MPQLAFLDYLVIAIYLVVTVGLGLWIGSYVKTGKDLFLAGRTLPWWAVGVSLVATDIGGTDMIGVGGVAYRWGVSVANFEWLGCIPAMIVAAFIFIPHFWRCGISTIPEYLELRFSSPLRSVVSGCWFVFMACNLGVMLLASAKFLEALLGWPVPVGIIGTAVLAGCYTYAGGLAAVVYTDVLQGVVMLVGCFLTVIIGLWQIGGIEPLREQIKTHLDARHAQQARLIETSDGTGSQSRSSPSVSVTQHTTDDHFSLILPVDTPSPFPWPAIVFGLAFVLSPGYWIGNQAIVQRALGARSEFDAKAAYVMGAVLKNLIPIAIVVPGLIALVRFPELADQDTALPTLVATLLPDGLRGLFVAAFLAALMSSVDSYLNSAATLFTCDFYQRFLRPQADERQLLQAGRFITLVLAVWALSFAFYLSTVEAGLYSIFQTMLSFFQGPAIAVLFCGLLTRRATADAALMGFFLGVATSISLFVLNQPAVSRSLGMPPLFQISDPFLYYSIWAFLVTIGTTLLLSYFSRESTPQQQRYALGGLVNEETR